MAADDQIPKFEDTIAPDDTAQHEAETAAPKFEDTVDPNDQTSGRAVASEEPSPIAANLHKLASAIKGNSPTGTIGGGLQAGVEGLERGASFGLSDYFRKTVDPAFTGESPESITQGL